MKVFQFLSIFLAAGAVLAGPLEEERAAWQALDASQPVQGVRALNHPEALYREKVQGLQAFIAQSIPQDRKIPLSPLLTQLAVRVRQEKEDTVVFLKNALIESPTLKQFKFREATEEEKRQDATVSGYLVLKRRPSLFFAAKELIHFFDVHEGASVILPEAWRIQVFEAIVALAQLQGYNQANARMDSWVDQDPELATFKELPSLDRTIGALLRLVGNLSQDAAGVWLGSGEEALSFAFMTKHFETPHPTPDVEESQQALLSFLSFFQGCLTGEEEEVEGFGPEDTAFIKTLIGLRQLDQGVLDQLKEAQELSGEDLEAYDSLMSSVLAYFKDKELPAGLSAFYQGRIKFQEDVEVFWHGNSVGLFAAFIKDWLMLLSSNLYVLSEQIEQFQRNIHLGPLLSKYSRITYQAAQEDMAQSVAQKPALAWVQGVINMAMRTQASIEVQSRYQQGHLANAQEIFEALGARGKNIFTQPFGDFEGWQRLMQDALAELSVELVEEQVEALALGEESLV